MLIRTQYIDQTVYTFVNKFISTISLFLVKYAIEIVRVIVGKS